MTAKLDTGGKVLAAFKCHQGNRRLKLPNAPADSDLDLAASITADGRHVYVTIVNRSIRDDRTLELTLKNMVSPLKASARFLVAEDLAQPVYSSFPIPSGPSATLVATMLHHSMRYLVSGRSALRLTGADAWISRCQGILWQCWN